MSKKGGFWIELAPPIKGKLESLLEFVRENNLLGVLDQRYIAQWLTHFDEMQVTKLKIKVANLKGGEEEWRLSLVINHYKDFEGTGPTFEDAIINVCENIERCIAS